MAIHRTDRNEFAITPVALRRRERSCPVGLNMAGKHVPSAGSRVVWRSDAEPSARIELRLAQALMPDLAIDVFDKRILYEFAGLNLPSLSVALIRGSAPGASVDGRSAVARPTCLTCGGTSWRGTLGGTPAWFLELSGRAPQPALAAVCRALVRALFYPWQDQALQILSSFRRDFVRAPHDPGIGAPVKDLEKVDTDFSAWWRHQDFHCPCHGGGI